VAARSQACVFGRSLVGIVGSNPAERHAYWSVVFAVCCVVSGLYDELITRLGNSYRVCVSECDLYSEDVLAQPWGLLSYIEKERGISVCKIRNR
jgi:hypothetical protein